MRGGAVEVTVSGLRATDTDMYRCVIEVFYPPPYLRLTGNGTLIHVLGETLTFDMQTHVHVNPQFTCSVLQYSVLTLCSSISFVHRQL